MSLAAIVDALIAAGCTAEQIGAAVKAAEAEREAAQADRRAKATEKKRKQRIANKPMSPSVPGTVGDSGGQPPPDGSPKNNNQTLPSPPPVPSLRSGTARTEFHEIFWPEYPHKTGKPVAEKSFIRARKSHDLDAIMAGLRTYVRVKPADRDWLNPATFLNQERFLDAPAATVHRPTFGQPQGQPPPAYVSPYAAPKGLTLEEARIEAAKIHARGQAR